MGPPSSGVRRRTPPPLTLLPGPPHCHGRGRPGGATHRDIGGVGPGPGAAAGAQEGAVTPGVAVAVRPSAEVGVANAGASAAAWVAVRLVRLRILRPSQATGS